MFNKKTKIRNPIDRYLMSKPKSTTANKYAPKPIRAKELFRINDAQSPIPDIVSK